MAARDRPADRPDGRHRRDDPGRAGPDHPGRRRPGCWSCRAGRAPARPRSPCTGRPTCSTPTATGWPAAACWSSARTPTFLRYIGQVLPSLGETGVVLGTVGQLFPGLDAPPAEAPEVAEVKGRPEMAEVVAAAVRDRQQVPRAPGRAGRRAAAGAARPATWPTPRARRARRVPPAAQRGQADLPPGRGAAARRAGGAQLGRPGRRAACSTPATCPTSATSWPRAGS